MMTGPVANTDTPMSGRSQPSAKHRSTSCAAKAARGSCLRTRRRSARPKGSKTSRRPAAEGRQLARPTHVALVRTRPSGERPLRDRRAIVRSARTGDFGRTGGNPLGRAGSRGFRSGLQSRLSAGISLLRDSNPRWTNHAHNGFRDSHDGLPDHRTGACGARGSRPPPASPCLVRPRDCIAVRVVGAAPGPRRRGEAKSRELALTPVK